jgi:hypothetical protein
LEAELSGLRECFGARHRAAQADPTSGEGAFGRDPQAAHHADGAPQTKKRGSPGLVNLWRTASLNAI